MSRARLNARTNEERSQRRFVNAAERVLTRLANSPAPIPAKALSMPERSVLRPLEAEGVITYTGEAWALAPAVERQIRTVLK